jgi:hypothetical protein
MRMDDLPFITGAICVVAFCIALFVGITHWNSNTNAAYYGALNQCTQAGGMWIPSYSSGICVRR